MPSRLPPAPTRPKQGPFPPPGCPRLHGYYGPLGLPSGSARFRLPPYARGLCPTWAAGEGLSCSAPILRSVPPPLPRGAPAPVPEQGRCASPSPWHDRLGAPERLSAENLTRLKRSPCCGPLLRFLRTRGFRRTARPGRSPTQAGACFRALRRLPGPDSRRLDRCSFHDAPCAESTSGPARARSRAVANGASGRVGGGRSPPGSTRCAPLRRKPRATASSPHPRAPCAAPRRWSRRARECAGRPAPPPAPAPCSRCPSSAPAPAPPRRGPAPP